MTADRLEAARSLYRALRVLCDGGGRVAVSLTVGEREEWSVVADFGGSVIFYPRWRSQRATGPAGSEVKFLGDLFAAVEAARISASLPSPRSIAEAEFGPIFGPRAVR